MGHITIRHCTDDISQSYISDSSLPRNMIFCHLCFPTRTYCRTKEQMWQARERFLLLHVADGDAMQFRWAVRICQPHQKGRGFHRLPTKMICLQAIVSVIYLFSKLVFFFIPVPFYRPNAKTDHKSSDAETSGSSSFFDEMTVTNSI
jgi:hypothetical protein